MNFCTSRSPLRSADTADQCACTSRRILCIARAYRDNRGGQACDLLAPIHSRFMAGFDTLELKEANALLDESA
jgi:hypothetical protein